MSSSRYSISLSKDGKYQGYVKTLLTSSGVTEITTTKTRSQSLNVDKETAQRISDLCVNNLGYETFIIPSRLREE